MLESSRRSSVHQGGFGFLRWGVSPLGFWQQHLRGRVGLTINTEQLNFGTNSSWQANKMVEICKMWLGEYLLTPFSSPSERSSLNLCYPPPFFMSPLMVHVTYSMSIDHC